MKKFFIFMLSFLILNTKDLMSQNLVYDFDNQSDLSNWIIVNDDVMGGISSSEMSIDNNGNGVFEGHISTANNGGFSSFRLNLEKIDVKKGAYFQIKLKGDNKEYQFRIKTNRMDYYSYVIPFKTSNEWETITIQLKDMYPSFRGRKLKMNNFEDNYFEQITFLVVNKKNEKFKLLIDSITLYN